MYCQMLLKCYNCDIEVGHIMAIFDKLPDLSGVELKIYNYAISNADDVSYMSIQELAKKTYSSTASILRLCKKLDCSGFSEFKFKLKQSLAEERKQGSLHFKNDVRETLELLYHQSATKPFVDAIRKAAQILASKSMVIFAGLGSSDIAASYGARYFSYVVPYSFRIEAIEDYTVGSQFVSDTMHSEICVVALSISGDTRDVLRYVKGMNLARCSLIAITANSYSKLAGIADVVIPYSLTKLTRNNADLNSQIPCMFILELLAQELYNIKSGMNMIGDQT